MGKEEGQDNLNVWSGGLDWCQVNYGSLDARQESERRKDADQGSFDGMWSPEKSPSSRICSNTVRGLAVQLLRTALSPSICRTIKPKEKRAVLFVVPKIKNVGSPDCMGSLAVLQAAYKFSRKCCLIEYLWTSLACLDIFERALSEERWLFDIKIGIAPEVDTNASEAESLKLPAAVQEAVPARVRAKKTIIRSEERKSKFSDFMKGKETAPAGDEFSTAFARK